MTTFSIIRSNMGKRPLSTGLTVLSVALASALILSVNTIQRQTDESYRQTSAGFDLILAAKGSPMQTALNTLYHLETSTGVIPFAVYQTALRDPRVEAAYPFYVGDSYRGLRVVGTVQRYLAQGEPSKDRRFELAVGRLFEGLNEVVMGSEAARRTGHQVGDTLVLSHGLTEPPAGAERLEHDAHPVVVTGILRPTGTAHDRVLFTDVRTTAGLHEVRPHHGDAHAHDHDSHQPVVSDVDAVALKMKNPQLALQVAGTLNFPTPDNPVLRMNMARDPYFAFKPGVMAVLPAQQIAALMAIVGNAERVLRILSVLVLVVAFVTVLVALVNTMDSRRRDLAVFRALGARRGQLLRIMVGEAGALVVIGSVFGWLGCQILLASLAPVLLQTAGVRIAAFHSIPLDLSVLAMMAAASLLVGLLPGWSAYRSDPVRHLQPS
jgi:putative ABC transport system permease protein